MEILQLCHPHHCPFQNNLGHLELSNCALLHHRPHPHPHDHDHPGHLELSNSTLFGANRLKDIGVHTGERVELHRPNGDAHHH